MNDSASVPESSNKSKECITLTQTGSDQVFPRHVRDYLWQFSPVLQQPEMGETEERSQLLNKYSDGYRIDKSYVEKEIDVTCMENISEYK